MPVHDKMYRRNKMKGYEIRKSPIICTNCKSRSFEVVYNYEIELVEIFCSECGRYKDFNLMWVL